MSIVYDPTLHATAAAERGGQLRLFHAVNKLLNDAAASGWISLVESETEPADTSAIWLHITKPETTNGIPKAYSGGAWVPLTPYLFYRHIAGGDAGFVTNTEMDSAILAAITSHLAAVDPHPQYLTAAEGNAAYQPLDADLTSWAAVGRATGFDTFAATPSSANLRSILTDETGTGAAVFANSPALVTPDLGTPSAIVLTNATGLTDTGHGNRGGGALHANATTSVAGFMSGADKTKLDGVEAGAQVNVATDLSYTASTRVLASSTGADVTLPLVSSSEAGLAPASGGGSTNFLRADGTWAAPAGSGGISDGDKGDISVSVGGTVWTIENDAVTYAKIQNVAANSVLARAAGTSGDVSEVALAASQILGRGSTGDVAALSLASHVEISGTTLNGNKAPTLQLFTSSGTWTKPSGCRFIKVTCVGGGGAGGGATAAASQLAVGFAGSGGAGCIKWLNATSLTSETVTIGAAGSGGSGAGGSGGASSFGSHCSAGGGLGGTASWLSSGTSAGAWSCYGVAQATATGGDVNRNGASPPGAMTRTSGTSGSSAGGAEGPFGLGAGGPPRGPGTSGDAATGFGAGGGAGCANSATNRTGGNGSQGVVIVEEFY